MCVCVSVCVCVRERERDRGRERERGRGRERENDQFTSDRRMCATYCCQANERESSNDDINLA